VVTPLVPGTDPTKARVVSHSHQVIPERLDQGIHSARKRLKHPENPRGWGFRGARYSRSTSVFRAAFESILRIDLPTRQFSAAAHELDIARVAEQAVALLSGQLFDDAELLQVAESLVDRGRGNTSFLNQRA